MMNYISYKFPLSSLKFKEENEISFKPIAYSQKIINNIIVATPHKFTTFTRRRINTIIK